MLGESCQVHKDFYKNHRKVVFVISDILMIMKNEDNIAFIDWQNLHMGTSGEGWSIDHKKFRVYLKDQYQVRRAYYFIGCLDDDNQGL